jgi:hypothetical protein
MTDGTLIFINNIIDYGLPVYFSPDRPRSVKEIVSFMEDELKLKILELQRAPPERLYDDDRLLLVCRKGCAEERRCDELERYD